MYAITFDTLEKTVIPKEQAESFAIVEIIVLREMVSANELAMTHDIEALLVEIKEDVQDLRQEIKDQNAEI